MRLPALLALFALCLALPSCSRREAAVGAANLNEVGKAIFRKGVTAEDVDLQNMGQAISAQANEINASLSPRDALAPATVSAEAWEQDSNAAGKASYDQANKIREETAENHKWTDLLKGVGGFLENITGPWGKTVATVLTGGFLWWQQNQKNKWVLLAKDALSFGVKAAKAPDDAAVEAIKTDHMISQAKAGIGDFAEKQLRVVKTELAAETKAA